MGARITGEWKARDEIGVEELRLPTVLVVLPKRETQKGCSAAGLGEGSHYPILNISYLHFHMYNFITRVGCQEGNVSLQYVEALPQCDAITSLGSN